MRPPETIETARLMLRKPRMEDAPAIFEAYAHDAEVTRYLTWRPDQNLEETEYYVSLAVRFWDEGTDYSYAITLKGSNSPIGMIALHSQAQGFKVGLGYVLARPYWGKGYMTEATRVLISWLLEQPDIYRVFATCDVENPASARVMEKAGMTCEGRLRRNAIHPNVSDEPRDSYIYAIVK